VEHALLEKLIDQREETAIMLYRRSKSSFSTICIKKRSCRVSRLCLLRLTNKSLMPQLSHRMLTGYISRVPVSSFSRTNRYDKHKREICSLMIHKEFKVKTTKRLDHLRKTTLKPLKEHQTKVEATWLTLKSKHLVDNRGQTVSHQNLFNALNKWVLEMITP